MASGPVARTAHGVRVRVRVAPKAARDGVQGLAAEADGGTVVKVRVAAAPEGGKANAALIGLLAKEWGVAKSAIAITGGAADRRKTLTVRGDAAMLAARLTAWAAGLPKA